MKNHVSGQDGEGGSGSMTMSENNLGILSRGGMISPKTLTMLDQ